MTYNGIALIADAVNLVLSSDNNLSAVMVRKAAPAIQLAHKVLMTEAQLIKRSFNPGMTLPDLVESAKGNQQTGAAANVLHMLTSHMNK